MEIEYHVVGTKNSYILMPDWTYVQSGVFVVLRCRSPPFQSGLLHFKNFRLEEKRMAYNNGRENRKWLIWKEAEEKILREYGVDETTIDQIRTDDRADFNSNRRFYHWTSDFGEYLRG